MLPKIAGGALLLVGAILAFKMLIGVVWAILSVAFVGALIYFGWRLFTR